MTELIAQPIYTELFYRATFQEPIPDLFKEEGRTALLQKIVKDFGIRLNQIKVNRESPSDAFLTFPIFEGETWFDVSYGLEEITARLQRPKDEEQVIRLYSTIADCFKQYPMSRQRMNIQHQLGVQGDSGAYLKSLNPQAPNGFEDKLTGRGVFYTLGIEEHSLVVHISVAASLFVKGGVFVSIENDFNPNNYGFQRAFSIVKEGGEFVLKELGIHIEQVA